MNELGPVPELKTAGSEYALPILWGGGIVIFMGLVFLVMGVSVFSKAVVTQDWVRVKGKIVSSGEAVQSRLVTDMTNNADGMTSTTTGTMTYSVNVVYEYQFQGKNYTGSQIGLSSVDFSNRAAAQRKASQYSSGGEVSVFVHPSVPEESILEREESGVALGFLLTGILFGLLGIWGISYLPAMIALLVLEHQGTR